MPVINLSNMFGNDITYNIINPEKAILFGMKKSKNNRPLVIIGSHYLGPAISKIFKISFDKL